MSNERYTKRKYSENDRQQNNGIGQNYPLSEKLLEIDSHWIIARLSFVAEKRIQAVLDKSLESK